MGFKHKLKRLERAARGALESIELADGSRYWYDPHRVAEETFLYGCACLRADSVADRPEPPEIWRVVANARDRRAARSKLYPDDGSSWSLFPFEEEALVERGELVHRSMVVGRGANDPAEDLSEP